MAADQTAQMNVAAYPVAALVSSTRCPPGTTVIPTPTTVAAASAAVTVTAMMALPFRAIRLHSMSRSMRHLAASRSCTTAALQLNKSPHSTAVDAPRLVSLPSSLPSGANLPCATTFAGSAWRRLTILPPRGGIGLAPSAMCHPAAAVRAGGVAGSTGNAGSWAASAGAGWGRGALAAGGAGRLAGPMRPQLHLRRGMATQASAGGPAGAGGPSSSPAAGGGSLLWRFRGRLGDALRLHVAAAWHSYGKLLYVAGAVAAVYLTWRLMHTVTQTFIAVNDKVAEYGILGMAITTVVLAWLYLRWRVAVNPAAVYRQAMVKLNTSPGVLEVMGAPLAGSPVRAYVVTGGGVYLSKKFRLKLRSRRIQMMFPLSGSERRGLVSLEAKRKAGKYAWKLLAVDLGPELQQALPGGGAPNLSAAPPPRQPLPGELQPPQQQRVFVVGGEADYQRSGVLGELRAPFLKALSNSRSYEVEDELEDELDELELPGSSSAAGLGAAAGGAVQRVRGVLSSVMRAQGGGGGTTAADPGIAPEAPAAQAGTRAASGGSAVVKGPSSATAVESAAAVERPGERGVLEQAKAADRKSVAMEAAGQQGGSGGWWSRMKAVVSGLQS